MVVVFAFILINNHKFDPRIWRIQKLELAFNAVT